MKIISSQTQQSSEARNILRRLGFRCTALGKNEKWEKRTSAVTIVVTLSGAKSSIDAYLGKAFVPFFSSKSYSTEHTLSYVKRVLDTFDACSAELIRLIPIAASVDADHPGHKVSLDGQLQLASLLTRIFSSSDDEDSTFDFSTFDRKRNLPMEEADNEFNASGKQTRKTR